jgi:precorrin-6B methylase 2
MLVPKLLGCYELELRPVLSKYLASGPAAYIDVGAAEGYYAVGLAWSSQGNQVTAFESTDEGRRLIGEIARLNEVESRVEVLSFCNPERLAECVERVHPRLIIIDVEGFEADLLVASVLPGLRRVDLIVELHPWLRLDVESVLIERFRDSHEWSRILPCRRKARDLPFPMAFSAVFGRWLLPSTDEGRPAQTPWLHLTSKAQQRRCG